jgi:hypothetical protein
VADVKREVQPFDGAEDELKDEEDVRVRPVMLSENSIHTAPAFEKSWAESTSDASNWKSTANTRRGRL